MANKLPALRLDGAEELRDLIAAIPDRVYGAAGRALRKAGSKVAKSIRSKLTRGAGVETGQYRKSIGIRGMYRNKKRGVVSVYIGPRKGFSVAKGNRKHDPYYIPHLLEFGHRIAVGGKLARGKNKSTGVQKGVARAIPHLRPAMDENRATAVALIGDELKKELEKRGGK